MTECVSILWGSLQKQDDIFTKSKQKKIQKMTVLQFFGVNLPPIQDNIFQSQTKQKRNVLQLFGVNFSPTHDDIFTKSKP